MRFKVCVIAALGLFAGSAMVSAQTLAQISGPKEQPPASFDGQQYVDSRGCVFLRAGIGGQTNWVPRVKDNREILCGFPPTFGAKPVIEMADEAPVAAETVVVAAPAVAPPQTVRVAPAPMAVAARPAPATPTRHADAGSAPRGKVGCPATAPVLMRVGLRDGGTALLCTRGDGTLVDARSPSYPPGSGVGAALSPNRYVLVSPGRSAPATGGQPARVAAAVPVMPAIPKGYKAAWTDDRLNVHRGRGTATGQAAQDQIWTRTVPARLVADEPVARRAIPVQEPQVVLSSRSDPAGDTVAPKRAKKMATNTRPAAPPPATGPAAFVQVGTFGQPSNADGAADRLQALGLPVSRARISKGGKSLQVVYAGPFATRAEAQSALSAARQAGFGDAVLR